MNMKIVYVRISDNDVRHIYNCYNSSQLWALHSYCFILLWQSIILSLCVTVSIAIDWL